ncbi:hypothetical protein Ancab_014505, partial [Ancistrocladus abbreviatus]
AFNASAKGDPFLGCSVLRPIRSSVSGKRRAPPGSSLGLTGRMLDGIWAFVPPAESILRKLDCKLGLGFLLQTCPSLCSRAVLASPDESKLGELDSELGLGFLS